MKILVFSLFTFVLGNLASLNDPENQLDIKSNDKIQKSLTKINETKLKLFIFIASTGEKVKSSYSLKSSVNSHDITNLTQELSYQVDKEIESNSVVVLIVRNPLSTDCKFGVESKKLINEEEFKKKLKSIQQNIAEGGELGTEVLKLITFAEKEVTDPDWLIRTVALVIYISLALLIVAGLACFLCKRKQIAKSFEENESVEDDEWHSSEELGPEELLTRNKLKMTIIGDSINQENE